MYECVPNVHGIIKDASADYKGHDQTIKNALQARSTDQRQILDWIKILIPVADKFESTKDLNQICVECVRG